MKKFEVINDVVNDRLVCLMIKYTILNVGIVLNIQPFFSFHQEVLLRCVFELKSIEDNGI